MKAAGATDANAALCVPGTLDATKAVGKVVQCDRGVFDRIDGMLPVAIVVGAIAAGMAG